MKEAAFQHLIKTNSSIREDLGKILEISPDFKLFPEDEYINGITADFSLISRDKIKAIIECKGGNINVTDYVRGIGQVFQYEYFCEEDISPRSYYYDNDFNTILMFPSKVLRNNDFNIGRFKYPQSLKLIEVNEVSYAVREIEKKELLTLESATEQGLTTISQYYVRDTRIFELYILLRFLSYLKIRGRTSCSRKEVEKLLVSNINVINNGNWRNVFISLASLGFIDNNNMPTATGMKYAAENFEYFALELYKGYIKPYFTEIYEAFEKEGEFLVEIDGISNQKICEHIRSEHRWKDVLFLTESAGRYISSWLNIMRDDYGCLDFQPRNRKKRIIYNPDHLNDRTIMKNIRSYSEAYHYIDNFLSWLNII